MSRGRELFAGAGLLALLAASTAAAQYGPRYLGFKMQATAASPFEYYYDARVPNPVLLPLASVATATENAWETWEAVACAYPAFTQLGPSSGASGMVDPRDPYDAFNVSTLWVTDENDPYYAYALGSGLAGATSIPTHYGGWLYQCDVYMNGVHYQWSTGAETPPQSLDVRTFVLHEAGHCLGLDHTHYSVDDVMYPVPPKGARKLALSPADIEGVCALYPQEGEVGSPCTVAEGCKNGLTCINAVAADGGSHGRICSRGCTPGAEPPSCPQPYVCRATAQIPNATAACMPAAGDGVTAVGRACTQNDQCGSGYGQCQLENNPGPLPSGYVAWNDGYCTQLCGPGQPGCPLGSHCVAYAGQQRCLKSCRPGTGDCRQGYACADIGDDNFACVSACHGDVDCNPNGGNAFACRACDGTCVARQDPTAQLGDACEVAEDCGLGQTCLKFGTAATGVCSQPCFNACTACPSGSTCHPVGVGQDFYCLRDCVDGTCGPGQQCGHLATGRGCVPSCVNDLECPVGNSCVDGQCVNPFADAGCKLCGGPGDGGPNVEPPAPEQPAEEEGCGCQGAGGGMALMAGVLAWLALGARRRTS